MQFHCQCMVVLRGRCLEAGDVCDTAAGETGFALSTGGRLQLRDVDVVLAPAATERLVHVQAKGALAQPAQALQTAAGRLRSEELPASRLAGP